MITVAVGCTAVVVQALESKIKLASPVTISKFRIIGNNQVIMQIKRIARNRLEDVTIML